jgi:hypothetical protein
MGNPTPASQNLARLSALERRVARFSSSPSPSGTTSAQVDTIVKELSKRLDAQHRVFSAQLAEQRTTFLAKLHEQQSSNEALRRHLKELMANASSVSSFSSSSSSSSSSPSRPLSSFSSVPPSSAPGTSLLVVAGAFLAGVALASSYFQRVQARGHFK